MPTFAARRTEGRDRPRTIRPVILPLGTDRPLHRPPAVTIGLLLINISIFAAMLAMSLQNGPENVPAAVHWGLRWEPTEPWRLITYAFIHDHTSIWHLLGNMLFLWVFGPSVEDRFGRLGFAAFYLAGAALAGLAQIASSPGIVIGASGAVAAVSGAFIVMFPRTRIKTLILFFVIGIYQIPATVIIAIALVRDFLGLAGNTNVAELAHLAGYAFGMTLAGALLATGVLKSEPFDLMHMLRQSRRRAEIRKAASTLARDMSRIRNDTSATPGSANSKVPASASLPPSASPAPQSPAASPSDAARAAIARLVSAGDFSGAADAYRKSLDADASAVVLARAGHLKLANYLHHVADHATAASAYAAFLSAYPGDPEAPFVRLMLAVLHARYLRQPLRARPLVVEALPQLRDPEQAAFARELLAEIDRQPDQPRPQE